MKTVSQQFIDAQNKHSLKYYKQANMYRRYWSGSEYLWETTPIDLMSYLKSVDNVNWQLDTEDLNVWRVANLQIHLKNDLSRFNETGVGGIGFFHDNYVRHKTKIEIKVGYILIDGSKEDVYTFAGLIDKDVRTNFKDSSIILTLTGKEKLLRDASAENVGQQRSDTLWPNGVITDFTLNHYGVGRVKAVYLDGVKLTEGQDYTVTGLNQYLDRAHVIFTVAPSIGQVPVVEYITWYRWPFNQVGFVVGKLLDEAGFGPSERFIDSVLFDFGRKYSIWDTQGEFEGTHRSRNLTTTQTPGNVEHKSEDFVLNRDSEQNLKYSGTYPNQSAEVLLKGWRNKYECNQLPTAATPVWTKSISWQNLNVEEINPAGIFHFRETHTPGGMNYVRYYRNVQTGTVKWRLKMAVPGLEGNRHGFDVYLYNGSYWIQIYCLAAGSGTWWAGIDGGTGSWTLSEQDWSDYHEFWACILEDGSAKFYVDGVERSSRASCAASTTNQVKFEIYGPGGTNYITEGWLDWMWDNDIGAGYTTSEGSGWMISTPVDFGEVPSLLGNIIGAWTDPGDGSTITLQTQTSDTSDFSSGNDIWRDISFAGNVGTIDPSTIIKRYIRWKVEMTCALLASPVLTHMCMPGHMLTGTIDCTSNIIDYVSFESWGEENDGVMKYYSQSSDGSWDPELEVIDSVIVSAIKRYIRFRTVFYRTTVLGTTPKLYKQKFTRTENTFALKFANFSGMSVQTAMEELAKIFDYEIGIDTEGKFFFRRKNTSPDIDMQLSHDINIIDIDNFNSGWSRVKNRVIANWGGFSRLMTPRTEDEPRPDSIDTYGTLELEVSGGTIEVDDTLDVAHGICQLYYERYKNPKKSFRIITKMLPQLELGDTVNVNYLAEPWIWWWGKKDAYYGKKDLFYYSGSSIAIKDLVCNVTGIEVDLNNWKMFINVREL
nr:hypothetical protein 26 [Elusimicrobiota bacterium]